MVRTIASSSGNRQTATQIVPDDGLIVNLQFLAGTRLWPKLGRFLVTASLVVLTGFACRVLRELPL
jgi:hypothetical protein